MPANQMYVHFCLIAVLALISPATASTRQFLPPVPYSEDVGGTALASGDLDGDGDIDIVASNRTANNISVLMNQGDGTFAPHITYPTGLTPRSVAIADFDGDGDIDLAVAMFGSHEMLILDNDGAGAFSITSVLATDLEPHGIVAVDFDNDGNLDVCVGNVGSTFVSNYYNLNGVFEPSIEVWTTNVVSFVIAADLNADGMQDIIVGNPGNVLYVLINSSSFDTIPQDFNHDGAVTAADLAVLLGVWGTADQAADFDNNGVVDSADLASLLANWSP